MTISIPKLFKIIYQSCCHTRGQKVAQEWPPFKSRSHPSPKTNNLLRHTLEEHFCTTWRASTSGGNWLTWSRVMESSSSLGRSPPRLTKVTGILWCPATDTQWPPRRARRPTPPPCDYMAVVVEGPNSQRPKCRWNRKSGRGLSDTVSKDNCPLNTKRILIALFVENQ